jgi:hypothetical protein
MKFTYFIQTAETIILLEVLKKSGFNWITYEER